MTFSKFLADSTRPLVLDTSVLINLHACTYGERILTAIPNDIIVPQIVFGELTHETSRMNGEHSFLQGLAQRGEVVLASMTDAEYEIFADLTSGSSSLDDGEAATIAIAVVRQFFPIIDERKGRAHAATLIKGQESGWTLDLMRHPLVTSTLGNNAFIDALYLALRDGRMRIPASSAEGVIAAIGTHRAIECTCLPGYRERFGGQLHQYRAIVPNRSNKR
jgi:predicted nucleic acid-binding protein